jgi:hypothetical protein
MITLENSVNLQPNFPAVDMSDANAQVLSLLISNHEVRTTNFDAVMKSRCAYNAANNVFDLLEHRRVIDDSSRQGIILGAQALIATCHVLNPGLENIHQAPHISQHWGVLSLDPLRAASRFTEASDAFGSDFPHTRDMIEQIAEYTRVSRQGALAGAAIAQQLGSAILDSKKLA